MAAGEQEHSLKQCVVTIGNLGAKMLHYFIEMRFSLMHGRMVASSSAKMTSPYFTFKLVYHSHENVYKCC